MKRLSGLKLILFPQVVTAFDGKSLEVEDEGGDKQIINVKDQQVDLPPLRCYSYPDIVNAIQQLTILLYEFYIIPLPKEP